MSRRWHRLRRPRGLLATRAQMVHGFAFRHACRTRPLRPSVAIRVQAAAFLSPASGNAGKTRWSAYSSSMRLSLGGSGQLGKDSCEGSLLKSVILSEGERKTLFIRGGPPSRSRRTQSISQRRAVVKPGRLIEGETPAASARGSASRPSTLPARQARSFGCGSEIRREGKESTARLRSG